MSRLHNVGQMRTNPVRVSYGSVEQTTMTDDADSLGTPSKSYMSLVLTLRSIPGVPSRACHNQTLHGLTARFFRFASNKVRHYSKKVQGFCGYLHKNNSNIIMSGAYPTKSTTIQTAIPVGNHAGMAPPSTEIKNTAIPLGNHAPGMAPPSGGFRRTSGLATASMVCGIVGLIFCGFILGVIAIILGIVAHANIKQNRHELTGECQATAGIITGSIALVGWILLVILLIVA
jgi:Domain of unknown function (DUF4190)